MSKEEPKKGFKKIVEENKSLVFTAPIFVILIIVVVIVYLGGSDNKSTDPIDNNDVVENPIVTTTVSEPDTSTPEVVVLPDTEREKEVDEIARNPFADPYKVSGIMYDSRGDSIAIIEAEDMSFTVKENETNEFFKVLRIEKDAVYIEVQEEEIKLPLGSN